MRIKNDTPFPIDAWSADMKSAVEEICDIGTQTLETHRHASDEAAEIAQRWKLAERIVDERVALNQLLEAIRKIFEAIEQTRQVMHSSDVPEAELRRSMRQCRQVIDDNLQGTEDAFLTVRHSALDLLRWTRRSGHLEESDLPGRYRASYAKLISYTPEIKPRLQRMQDELLQLRTQDGVHEDVQELISAISRYRAAAESARGFIKSVVDPPFELVFHDTDTFGDDWSQLDIEARGDLATEFNDCCQFLLYEVAEFERRVENVRPCLADGMEASLFVLAFKSQRVIFTVDEDPVFRQLIVTLLRVVGDSDYDEACNRVVETLYCDLADGDFDEHPNKEI